MNTGIFEINMLPVNEGDCIHIRFISNGNWYNIVIDSGPSASAVQFRWLMDQIRKRNEYVDLLCFTHTDDDHIKGAEMTFSELTFDSSHIKQIWMNLPESITAPYVEKPAPLQQNITVESAYKIYSHITTRGIPCTTRIVAGDELSIGGITITAVLPTADRLTAYYRKFETDLEQLHKSKPFLFIGGTRGDTNPYNGSSISLMLCTAAGKMLFSGDAFAPDLAAAAKSACGDDGFILMKLPHHGSDRNISKELLEDLSCQHFLCSTHATAHRPAQNTINLLADYGKTHNGVFLYGNYPWPFIKVPDHGITIKTLSDSKSPAIIGDTVLFTEG